MKTPTPMEKYRRLELRNHPRVTKLDPSLDNKMQIPSLVKEMILQWTDLVQVVTILIQMKGVAMRPPAEGLTTKARGHLKRSIVEEVKIIDSELPEYPKIEGKYKFYRLGWMSEAP
ncbi:hypothetical protein HAX54_006887 [Datura stramonium]|uniref:Uncharacterized protein n=1 Tax=Datura stramonium TaxID=4076 RepID=A0ABS8WZ35_DATST|nr:hypothetical protein [Datura stramonium]